VYLPKASLPKPEGAVWGISCIWVREHFRLAFAKSACYDERQRRIVRRQENRGEFGMLRTPIQEVEPKAYVPEENKNRSIIHAGADSFVHCQTHLKGGGLQ